jgi:hypothetical protein
MTEFDQIVMDGNSQRISVGTVIETLDDHVRATVYEITDVDSDYDDELERPVMYPPKVKFQYNNGEKHEASTSYVPVMTNPGVMFFACEDVKVISTDQTKGN